MINSLTNRLTNVDNVAAVLSETLERAAANRERERERAKVPRLDQVYDVQYQPVVLYRQFTES